MMPRVERSKWLTRFVSTAQIARIQASRLRMICADLIRRCAGESLPRTSAAIVDCVLEPKKLAASLWRSHWANHVRLDATAHQESEFRNPQMDRRWFLRLFQGAAI